VIRTPGAQAERIQAPEPGDDDAAEARLRPRRLDEFVGQEALKAQLSISIQAATARGEPMDHVLFAGPPGLGKTSLARIVAEELGVEFTTTSGPALERKAEIASFLTALSPNSVFFVDEIHRLPRAVEETFYPAMEDRQLPITLGVGAGARVVTLDLPPFTLIGATTRSGLLTSPLRDRFGIQHRLDHYSPDDLAAIVARSAGVLNVAVHMDGARAIAERSRGTPRVANRLLKRVRDYAQIHADGSIDAATAYAALDMLEVDHEGLDRLDREILMTICERFGGGPVGLSTLAVAVQEEQDTIEDVYEPYLLQRGFIQRTPRGRCATPHAYRHLGLTPPSEGQSLF
jgi:Holliday junction DNA helicase RuvB